MEAGNMEAGNMVSSHGAGEQLLNCEVGPERSQVVGLLGWRHASSFDIDV
jgi:hypothetical protein